MDPITPIEEIAKIRDLVDQLRDLGCAVVCFTHEELSGAEPDRVEERLVEMGWDVISYWSEDV